MPSTNEPAILHFEYCENEVQASGIEIASICEKHEVSGPCYIVSVAVEWRELLGDTTSARVQYAIHFVEMLRSADQQELRDLFYTARELSVGAIRSSVAE